MQETPIVAADHPSGSVLTLDKLSEVMREGQEKLDKINDQVVESLLLSGFRVIINDDMSHDMIAVLPGNFRGSLRRVTEKLRAGDRRFGFLNLNMLS